jgi:hypothetical protein
MERDLWKTAYENSHVVRNDDNDDNGGCEVVEEIDLYEGELQRCGIPFLKDLAASVIIQKFKTSNILVVGKTGFQGLLPLNQCSRIAMNIPDKHRIDRIFIHADNIGGFEEIRSAIKEQIPQGGD